MTRKVYPKVYPLWSGKQTKDFIKATDRVLHAMYRLEHRGLVEKRYKQIRNLRKKLTNNFERSAYWRLTEKGKEVALSREWY